jgi:hypothetical protein
LLDGGIGMKKIVYITVDTAIARRMLAVAGWDFHKIQSASDDEIFEKVLEQIDCYGASFDVKEEHV